MSNRLSHLPNHWECQHKVPFAALRGQKKKGQPKWPSRNIYSSSSSSSSSGGNSSSNDCDSSSSSSNEALIGWMNEWSRKKAALPPGLGGVGGDVGGKRRWRKRWRGVVVLGLATGSDSVDNW